MSQKEKFEQYHKDNKHVYEGFKRYAMQLINSGRTRLSSKLIYERLRWESALRGNDEYKLNNNYTAYHARMFMDELPQYDGYFSTRVTK